MKNPFYTKVDNTFHRVMEDVSRFDQVFRAGGKLEQAIMELGGDVSWLADIRKTLDTLQEQLEEAHYDAIGMLDPQTGEPMESIAESRSLTEGVLDNDDDDGFMARSQLYFLARDAITLHGMIGDRDNLAGWVQSKITTAAEGIEAVRRYTEYNNMKTQMEPQMMEPGMEEAVDNPYAVGMAQAMQSTGDRPPLKKATIRKAHGIARAIGESPEGTYMKQWYNYSEDFAMLELYVDGELVDKWSDYFGANETGNPLQAKFVEMAKANGVDPIGLKVVDGDDGDEGVFTSSGIKWNSNEVTESEDDNRDELTKKLFPRRSREEMEKADKERNRAMNAKRFMKPGKPSRSREWGAYENVNEAEAVTFNGKKFTSYKRFSSTAKANAFLEKNAAYGVIGEKDGYVYVAKKSNLGEAVAKIACTKCDEVSTAKAWEKNHGFCPKCKTSNQGVAESMNEAKEGDTIKYRNIKSKRTKTGTVKKVDTKNGQKRYEIDGGKYVYDSDLADVEKVAEEAKFDDKRDGGLKTVAQDMFKNALAAAKKKAGK